VSQARPGSDRRVVVLGRIGAAFGVTGWVKVNSFTDPLEGIVDFGTWELVRGGQSERRRVLDWKRAGKAVAVRLEGVDSRDAAQGLTGCEVQVDRSELAPTGEREYYWHDLVGLEARNRDGAMLGRVQDVLDLPAHPVLVLAGDRERLVPLVPQRLLGVDLDKGRVTLDWHLDD
jgi:16S rRNA processing protein RimM